MTGGGGAATLISVAAWSPPETLGTLIVLKSSTDNLPRALPDFRVPSARGRGLDVSSRKEQNGPTFGDKGGISRVYGYGFITKLFRSAKRL